MLSVRIFDINLHVKHADILGAWTGRTDKERKQDKSKITSSSPQHVMSGPVCEESGNRSFLNTGLVAHLRFALYLLFIRSSIYPPPQLQRSNCPHMYCMRTHSIASIGINALLNTLWDPKASESLANLNNEKKR